MKARQMFGEIAEPTFRVGSRKWYTVPLSIVAHVMVIGAVVVVPLIATDVLPTPATMMSFVLPAPPPVPIEVVRRPRPAVAPEPPPVVAVNDNFVPVVAPEQIFEETGFDLSAVGGVEGGVVGDVVVGRIVGGINEPPPPPPAEPEPVRVGGNISPPTKTKDAPPVYPPVAQSARVQGIVILEAVIGPSGRVTEVTVLRSVPLLDEAAIAAVKQWEYTPTLLNGVPVPVIVTVTVNFTLQ